MAKAKAKSKTKSKPKVSKSVAAKAAVKAKSKGKAKPSGKASAAAKVKPAAKSKAKVAKSAKKVVGKSASKAKVPTGSRAAKKTKSAGKAQPKKSVQVSKAPKSGASAAKKVSTTQNWSLLISPLDDRILVKVDEVERRTAGGLYLPETATVQGNHQATVVSVGPGHRDKKGRFRPIELKVGDRILFAEWTGSEVELENESFKILRETEVLGLLE